MRPADRRRSGGWLVPLVLAAALSGCSADGDDGGPAAAPTAVAGPSDATPFRSVRTLAPVAEPARVRVPAVGVDAPVVRLGTLPDGSVEVPSRWEDVGWYGDGPRPGEAGPAVLLGHVDSKAGPAVFARLGEVAAGDVVEVDDAGGGLRRFVVERLERHPKTAFPTEAVYLPTLRTELRLVTCGGRFDRASGHYVDNVVVFATAVA